MKQNEINHLLDLVVVRHDLRKIKKYKEADIIRKHILEMNFQIEDSKDGNVIIYNMKPWRKCLCKINPEKI